MGFFLLISHRKLWQQFASIVSCFERLSILGQFPAFLLHTSVHKALSITVPGFPLCGALYLSFLWSSLPNCERAWPRTVTYRAQLLTTARLFVVRWPPCTHWHIGTVTYQSHWEAKTKLGHQETIVLGCCTVPAYYNYSSLFYIQEISISICFVPQGAGRVGVGQIGPRFAARDKNSQLLGLLALTIDRFLTSVGFYTVCRVNMELHQIHLLFPYFFSW